MEPVGDRWRWWLAHLPLAIGFLTGLPPFGLYVAAALACWAVGHATGVPDGTNSSMTAGYGGGLGVTLLVYLLAARETRSVAHRLYALVDVLGYERALAASRAELVGQDGFGRLWRVPFRAPKKCAWSRS